MSYVVSTLHYSEFTLEPMAQVTLMISKLKVELIVRQDSPVVLSKGTSLESLLASLGVVFFLIYKYYLGIKLKTPILNLIFTKDAQI
jgi:hypothetical protein